MAGPRMRESLDGSESNFSLVDHDHVLSDESAVAEGGYGTPDAGASSDPSRSSYAIRALYPISTIMSNPRAASAAQTISTNLSNLNPLRPTKGPKTGATRGRAATPIVLSELPKVSIKSFDSYISSIKDEYTVWSKAQTALADAPLLDELEDDDLGLDDEASTRKKAIKRALEISNMCSKSSVKTELPDLSSVPPIFFEENFNLANPRTFDVVTAGHVTDGAEGSVASCVPSTDFSTDQILQEKLNYWLDVVELHLNVEISLRSSSFFAALSNLKDLDSQSAEAVKEIGNIKGILIDVDANVAKKGLYAVRQGIRRRRLNDLADAMERIKDILRALDQAEELGEAGETEGALDLADEIEREWEASISSTMLGQVPPTPTVEQSHETVTSVTTQEKNNKEASQGDDAAIPATPSTALRIRSDRRRPVRIAQIKALSCLPARLSALRSVIAQSLEHEIVAVLVHAAREDREALMASAEQWRAKMDVPAPVRNEMHERTINRIHTALRGIVRCGKPALDGIIVAWKEALLAEVQNYLKGKLPSSTVYDEEDGMADMPSSRSSVEDGRPSQGSTLQNGPGTQQLLHSDFMNLMRDVHTSMLALLTVAEIQSRAIIASVAGIIGCPDPSSVSGTPASEVALNNAWITALQSDLSDAVQAVAEAINARLARLVASRGDIHSRLPLADFYAVFSDNWQFVLDCETLSRKMIVGLRGVIVGQAKGFLQYFHQQTFTEVAQAVERDQWSAVDVPASTQAVVDRILQSAVSTPASWELKLNIAEDTSDSVQLSKQLAIEDRSYFAVAATLRCVEALENYLKIVINLPSMSTDVMSRVIEFLKQYNSRVCQMVLGAGAMRSAGLKNITAKHLAMASQSISILISIIPYTRECLRRHLRAKQAIILVDFDKLKRDCQEHQNEIHAKLVAIMGDRLAIHCKALQDIDWEQVSPIAGKPNAYMETLVKETCTLHKVLLKYLAGSALEIVMMQVLSAINSRLAEELGKIPLRSDAAKQRMLLDANYLRERFEDLKGLERSPPGAELVNLIQDKTVERPAQAAQNKSKQFNTPSMTVSRKPLVGHTRSPSTASLSHQEDTAAAVLAPNRPPGDNTDTSISHIQAVAEGAPVFVQVTSKDAIPELADQPSAEAARSQTQAQAEETPLPMSPERETPHLSLDNVAKESRMPLDLSSDVHVKPQEQFQGIPTVNVKNRLAGLFAKRPSLPNVDVPSIHNTLAKVRIPLSGHNASASSVTVESSGDTDDPETGVEHMELHHTTQDRQQAALPDSETASPEAKAASQSLGDNLLPGEVLTNGSEGSSEDLTVQTSSEGLSGSKDIPAEMAAVGSSMPAGLEDEPHTTQTEGDVVSSGCAQPTCPMGNEPDAVARGNATPTEVTSGEAGLPQASKQPQPSDVPILEENAPLVEHDGVTGEDDEADISGSSASTFETDVQSIGVAEHSQAHDDLDAID